MDITEVSKLAQQIRAESLRMVRASNSSHIGSVLSIADVLAVLYGRVLNVDPKNPSNPERDLFILSKGHACAGVYATLALCGFFAKSELAGFGKPGSIFMTHISHKVPGVEFSTGSLGHGLPFGVGKALAAKMSRSNQRVFVLLGDGEIGEGSNWEALLFASHQRLDNLCVVIDGNNLQSLTTVEKTLNLSPMREKFVAFGTHFLEVDGHNLESLESSLRMKPDSKPLVIYARTTKGKGVSFMENRVKWHYKSPNDDELRLALQEVGDPN